MVCLPCIVIPLFLWVFHKYIQPYLVKFWNPWAKKGVEIGNTKDIDTSTAEYKFIKEKISSNAVVMFSKSSCTFCDMGRKVLDGIGVEYQEEMIGQREDCSKLQDIFQQMTGSRTVPRVFIGEQCIGGGSETWTLHNQDRLIPMMQKAGAKFTCSDKKSD